MGPSRARSRGTILVVAYSYPPRPLSASIRPSALARHLRRMRYRVDVITSKLWGHAPEEGPGRVVRTRDLVASPRNPRRGNVDSYMRDADSLYSEQVTTLNRILVPDLAALTWTPFAVPAAVRLARSEKVDCVVTTSGPESAHVVGARLNRMGIPWIADLRDGWRFEPYRSWETRAQERLDEELERRLLPAADHVVTVSEPITQDLRDRLGVQATTIPNGYDPLMPVADSPPDHAAPDPDRFTFAHTGKLAAAGARPLGRLLEALRTVEDRRAPGTRPVEVILAGPMSRDEAALVDAAPPGMFRRVGPLDHPDSLALQAASDALLIATTEGRVGVIPSKLFEYMRAGRPILVLDRRSEASRTVERTRSGTCVPDGDVGALAAAIERMAAGETGFDPDASAARDSYGWPRLAERWAGVIETVRAR